MKSLVEAVREERDRAYYERTLELARGGFFDHPRRSTGPRTDVGAADWQEMVELRKQGRTLDQIAALTGFSKSTISRQFAKRLGREVQEARAAGRDVEAVRDLFGRRRGKRRVRRVQGVQDVVNGVNENG